MVDVRAIFPLLEPVGTQPLAHRVALLCWDHFLWHRIFSSFLPGVNIIWYFIYEMTVDDKMKLCVANNSTGNSLSLLHIGTGLECPMLIPSLRELGGVGTVVEQTPYLHVLGFNFNTSTEKLLVWTIKNHNVCYAMPVQLFNFAPVYIYYLELNVMFVSLVLYFPQWKPSNCIFLFMHNICYCRFLFFETN